MKTKFFVTLPVADVSRTSTFFKAIGWAQNPDMSDASTGCFVIGTEVNVMLVTHAKFMQLSPKPVCDPAKFKESLFCLGLDSRQQVDEMVAKALAAGGTVFEKAEDHGFMYCHSFIDPDGHGWGLACMNSTAPK